MEWRFRGWSMTCVLVCCLAGSVVAAPTLVGVPPVQRFAPDIDVPPAMFSVAQDAAGIVYVGNQDGVLEFDGESWRLLRLPNREIVRTLVAGPEGRIYVGGYNSFGYLARGAAGDLGYRELTPLFGPATAKRDFADIWDILVAPEGVYFRGVRDLFFWSPDGTTRQWHYDGRFGAIAQVRGRTLVQFRGEGFKRREGDDWILLPETKPLTELVFGLLELPDGGLLTRGVDGRWFRIGGGRVEPVAMPAGMVSSQFQQAVRLDDGSYAFGSGDGVVFLVSPDLHSARRVKVAPSFITELAPSRDGGILVSSAQAVYRVAWPSAWTLVRGDEGIAGSLYGLAEWDGKPVLLTSNGMYRVAATADGRLEFEADPFEKLSAYDLLELSPGRVLLARAHLLMLIEHGVQRPLSTEIVYPRFFRKSRFHANRYFVGTEAGLRTVDVEGANIRLSASFGEGDSTRINSIVETDANTLWAGSERNAAWRYRFRPDGNLASLERFADDRGLRLGVLPETWLEQMADGHLVASTREGWFRLDNERFVPYEPTGLAAWRQHGEILRLAQAPDGEWWAYTTNRVLHRMGSAPWRDVHVSRLGLGQLLEHRFGADGRIVFVGGQGLLLREGPETEPVRGILQLRELYARDGQGRRTPLAVGTPVELPADASGFEFGVALPHLGNVEAHRYRWRLAGYETGFSRWSANHEGAYHRLPHGRYTLEVQAQDGLGRTVALAPLTVDVQPAWHEAAPVRLGLAAVAVLSLVLLAKMLVRHRTRRLARRNRELEAQVARRTAELENANHALVDSNAQLVASRQAVIESGQRADLIFKALNDALAGTVLDDHYRIDARIGTGGFGTVYRATELHMDNVVAIKVFKPVPGHDAARSLERFRSEGHSAFRVNHPNAVRVLDFGICVDAVAYLVMEFLGGDSLAERLARTGPLPVPQVLDVLVPICRVLAHAHSVDVIHRDVKPSNILLCREGGHEVVKLIDFGIAKVLDESTPGGIQNLTATGLLMGTPNYMAPERFLDQPYDGRSDVFSVGVIAFEMLMGRRPFADLGENYVGSVMRRLQEPPPALRGQRPDVSDELAMLIESMLDRNAEGRPEAAALARRFADMRAAMDADVEMPRPSSAPTASTATSTAVLPTPRRVPPA
jgi:serine/threonine protein kinase